MEQSNSPLVSCIITNYNYGQYIGQAIQSVLDQTYTNMEIIVVDDGSSDNSISVVQKFSNKVNLLRQKNQGVVIARNNGAKASSGEYLFFLDADDCLHSDYVKVVLNSMIRAQKNDLNIVLGYTDQQLIGDSDSVVHGSPWNVKKLLYRNYLNVATIIRADAFKQVGGFNMALNKKHSFDDWDMWLTFAENGYKGIYITQPLAYYRIHEGGRNKQAIKQRREMEKLIQEQHAVLYQDFGNKLYLAFYRTLSTIRNLIHKPPAT